MTDNYIDDLFNKPKRKGSSGRVSDKLKERHRLFQKVNISIDPDTFDRLEAYCADEERARSWVVQRALDMWLKSMGY